MKVKVIVGCVGIFKTLSYGIYTDILVSKLDRGIHYFLQRLEVVVYISCTGISDFLMKFTSGDFVEFDSFFIINVHFTKIAT